MSSRALFVAVMIIIAAGLTWTDGSWSHPRPQKLPGDPPIAADTQARDSECSQSPKTAGTPGEVTLSFDSLKKGINVACGPERLAALMRLAAQAETHGHPDLALKVYTLAASSHPDSPEASRAILRCLIIKFYLSLGSGGDPFPPFQNFLVNLSPLANTIPPEELREPLVAGWSAIDRQVMHRLPGPIPLAEKVITLWELHPSGSRPPEAALLVGRLLKDHGIFEEAGQLLAWAWQKGTPQIRSQALIELLQLAWASQGLPGFLEALKRWRHESGELIDSLRRWRLDLCSQEAASRGDLANLLGRQAASSIPPHMTGIFDEPLGEAMQGQPLPPALQEYLVCDAAQRLWNKGDFAGASGLYRNALARVSDKEISVFYWDRLGIAHMRDRQPELAQEIFRTLAREHGQFWQLVAASRQLDLELNCLLNEPAS